MQTAKLIFLLSMLHLASLRGIDDFIVITPEKTGTHLLTKAITQLTGMEVENRWDRAYHPDILHNFLTTCKKNGTYCHTHIFPDQSAIKYLKKNKYKVIFLIRDPRDQLISALRYMKRRNWHYEQLSTNGPFGVLSADEQITEMITGKLFGLSTPKEMMKKRLKWTQLKRPPVFTVRYEKLVGPSGGGLREDQIKELTDIAYFIGLTVSAESIEVIADSIYGRPGEGTFEQGKIGTWKFHFNQSHKRKFKRKFGKMLIQLRYEQNRDW